MSDFVFAQGELDGLRNGLLAHAPNEAAAILLAGHFRRNGGFRLTARETVFIPSGAYLAQTPYEVTLHPEFVAPVLKRARSDGLSLILVHSHPFSEKAVEFSVVDDQGECKLFPSIISRAPERPHGSLVLGQSGFDGRIWNGLGNQFPINNVVEVGRELVVSPRCQEATMVVAETYDRSVRALGMHGQAALNRLTVGIIGLGGIGSLVMEQLAHLGVGRLILMDNDRVERTNLNRVVGANESSIGSRKVDVAAHFVGRISGNVLVETLFADVRFRDDAQRLLEADILLCCTDSHGSRAVLNQLAYQYFIPVIDFGVVIDARGGKVRNISGRVQLLAPGLSCLVCQNLLDPEEVRRDLLSDEERRRDPYIMGIREPQPAVISLNGTVASLGVTMLLAVATGFPSIARHQIYVAHRGAVRTIESRPDSNCVVCSCRGAFGRGDAWPMPWRHS